MRRSAAAMQGVVGEGRRKKRQWRQYVILLASLSVHACRSLSTLHIYSAVDTRRFRPEPSCARPCLGVFDARACIVLAEFSDLAPFEVDDFGEPRPGERRQADGRNRPGVFLPVPVQHRAEALQLRMIEVAGDGSARVEDGVGGGVRPLVAARLLGQACDV